MGILMKSFDGRKTMLDSKEQGLTCDDAEDLIKLYMNESCKFDLHQESLPKIIMMIQPGFPFEEEIFSDDDTPSDGCFLATNSFNDEDGGTETPKKSSSLCLMKVGLKAIARRIVQFKLQVNKALPVALKGTRQEESMVVSKVQFCMATISRRGSMSQTASRFLKISAHPNKRVLLNKTMFIKKERRDICVGQSLLEQVSHLHGLSKGSLAGKEDLISEATLRADLTSLMMKMELIGFPKQVLLGRAHEILDTSGHFMGNIWVRTQTLPCLLVVRFVPIVFEQTVEGCRQTSGLIIPSVSLLPSSGVYIYEDDTSSRRDAFKSTPTQSCLLYSRSVLILNVLLQYNVLLPSMIVVTLKVTVKNLQGLLTSEETQKANSSQLNKYSMLKAKAQEIVQFVTPVVKYHALLVRDQTLKKQKETEKARGNKKNVQGILVVRTKEKEIKLFNKSRALETTNDEETPSKTLFSMDSEKKGDVEGKRCKKNLEGKRKDCHLSEEQTPFKEAYVKNRTIDLS
ncbi:hypothetical protein Tco_0115312 [Tanacetum coccineum]